MSICISENQGKRAYMEDRWQHENINEEYEFVGVFDGHGGSEVAEICKVNFHKIIKQGLESSSDISCVLRSSFQSMDDLVEKYDIPTVGSTAVVCLVGKEKLWFANCGDSMAMVFYKNGRYEVVSQEHKVANTNEAKRIKDLGGNITDYDCPRIDSLLNLSRSIGDFHLKKYVICDPFIKHITINGEIDTILLASDGLWDVFDQYRLHNLKQDHGEDITAFTNKITLDASIKGYDNVTVMTIKF